LNAKSIGQAPYWQSLAADFKLVEEWSQDEDFQEPIPVVSHL